MKEKNKKLCPLRKIKDKINNRKLLVFLIFQAIIAGMYCTLTLPFSEISYKELQFRISEVLLFLMLFDRKHIIGITLGTFIANIFSPIPQYDLTLGVLATILACLGMGLFKKYYLLAFIFPALFNALLVPIGLNVVYEVPYLQGFVYVGISEIVLMYLLALPIFLIVSKTELKNLLYFDIYNKKLV